MTAILVIEDDAFQGLDLGLTLGDAGFRVIGPARTLQEANALLDGHRIDAAILDVNLGGERSAQIADRLVQRGTPFCFLTGHSREALEVRHRDREILSKPFNEAVLLQTLHDLCRGGRS